MSERRRKQRNARRKASADAEDARKDTLIMKRSMKVLIAYDGSPYADAALADLRWAGLPRETAVLVATACEIYPP